MASIQSKTGKSGKKTYYAVLSTHGTHKWVRAGSIKNARELKKHIELLREAERFEKLGLSVRDIRVDDFFQEYADYVKLHTAPSTAKRYLSVLNSFVDFLRVFHANMRSLLHIKPQTMESFQKTRLTSVDLKTAADEGKIGAHRNKTLPKPQTVNYENGVLRSNFLWAKKRELVLSVPTKDVKKFKPKNACEPVVLTPRQCKLYLKTARVLAKENEKNRCMRRYSSSFLILVCVLAKSAV